MRRVSRAGSRIMLLLAALALLAAPAQAAPAAEDETARFFESRIRPLLVEQCGACHGPRLQQGKLRLDSREGLLKGGARGPAVVPGKPEASRLLLAVRHAPGAPAMPPDARLPDPAIADLTRWIALGAPWAVPPLRGVPSPGSRVPGQSDAKAGSSNDHWAFRPVTRPTVPQIRNPQSAIRNPIDAFILAKLQAKGLSLSPPADRRALIRRATFDLTGLPPTPAEVETFVSDRSPDAFARVVDRLLASPRYGERWGRHWLDVARYADSNGLDENYHYANAWRYRDYVIDAFNRDLPYDQFLREQLAGDLLPSDDPAVTRRRLIATGFYLLGPKLIANPDKEQVLADIIDEQIDVTSRAMMGITLSCARCHDHKFDPLSQRDYYAFAGIFRSTRTMISLKDRIWSERPLASPEEVARFEAHQAALEAKRKALDAVRKKTGSGEAVAKLEAEVAELERTAPPPVPYALAVADGNGEDARLFIRGDHNQPSDAVPRGFPALLAGGPQPRLDASRSGRLELAQWITRPEHPLTARVMVNRVWQGHFGEGLVRTSDNFGRLGEPPSQPELLDWLAARFVGIPGPGSRVLSRPGAETVAERGDGLGWSVKALHRLIMLSATYQQSSKPHSSPQTPNPESKTQDPKSEDPENRLLWRQNRRRLSAEEQRDAMLRIGERLDLTMGGTLLTLPNKERVTNDGSTDLAAGVYDSRRRTVYLPVVRNSLFEMLELFDFVDPSVVTARRSETLASPQALFMLNHPLMRQAAGDFAAVLLRANARTDGERVGEAYLRAFGRPATVLETADALAYLNEYAASVGARDARAEAWKSFCHTLFCANEFLYVD